MHIPIVVCLQVWLLDVTLHWSMKFTFIMMATMALLLLVYDLWIRPGKIGVLLNGRRASSVLRTRNLPPETP